MPRLDSQRPSPASGRSPLACHPCSGPAGASASLRLSRLRVPQPARDPAAGGMTRGGPAGARPCTESESWTSGRCGPRVRCWDREPQREQNALPSGKPESPSWEERAGTRGPSARETAGPAFLRMAAAAGMRRGRWPGCLSLWWVRGAPCGPVVQGTTGGGWSRHRVRSPVAGAGLPAASPTCHSPGLTQQDSSSALQPGGPRPRGLPGCPPSEACRGNLPGFPSNWGLSLPRPGAASRQPFFWGPTAASPVCLPTSLPHTGHVGREPV